MNSLGASVRIPMLFPSGTEEADGQSCTVFLTSSGTGCSETRLSSWPAFTEAGILGSRAPAFVRAPNPRLQRTPLRAPLSRKPLGRIVSFAE
jgi:hypothetical protein